MRPSQDTTVVTATGLAVESFGNAGNGIASSNNTSRQQASFEDAWQSIWYKQLSSEDPGGIAGSFLHL